MVLPALHIAIYSCLMPVSAYVLGIYTAGDKEIRTVERTVARNETDNAMPPLGRVRIRPRAITS